MRKSIEISRREGSFAKENLGKIAAIAKKTIEGNRFRYQHGKTMLSKLRGAFQGKMGRSMKDILDSVPLENKKLKEIAKKIFRIPRN